MVAAIVSDFIWTPSIFLPTTIKTMPFFKYVFLNGLVCVNGCVLYYFKIKKHFM